MIDAIIDLELRHILKRYMTHKNDSRAVEEITAALLIPDKKKDNTIRIMGEVIDPICYNCGDKICPERGDEFMACFDHGEQDYPAEPDIPAEYYLICKNCVQKWLEVQK